MAYYFKSNKLGKRYSVQSWYSKVISGLWDIHLTEWRHFSSAIHEGDKKSEDKATIKPTLLKIVRKYYTASKLLPKYKKIWFRRDITKYYKFSIDHLRKWIRTARDILKRFQLNKRKKANQRKIQYNSIGQRVPSTNTGGRIPLIHNIVKISPIVFKRKQATLNLFLLNKTNATSTKISPSNKSNHIAKQTVNIINPETTDKNKTAENIPTSQALVLNHYVTKTLCTVNKLKNISITTRPPLKNPHTPYQSKCHTTIK